MKRALRFVAAILTLLTLFTATVSADVLQEKAFVHTGGPRPTANTDTVTFWEAPTLNAGESYAPGKLTLQNASDDPTTMTLTKMGLPYEQKEQLDYLDALHLIIRQEDRVVYDGSYARLSENPTALQVTLQPGESAVYTITLSRPHGTRPTLLDIPIVLEQEDAPPLGTGWYCYVQEESLFLRLDLAVATGCGSSPFWSPGSIEFRCLFIYLFIF